MTILTTMPRILPTVLLLSATAAMAADQELAAHVIVQAERPTSKVVGRTVTAPIQQVELRGRVSYADLELSIPSNAKVLEQRVHAAAQELCADLDRLYPYTEGGNDCARKAEEQAMLQVDAAIAAARSRRRGPGP